MDNRSARPGDARSLRPESRTPRRLDDEVVRGRPPVPPVAGGPRTSMAPIQAVPAPEAQPDKYSPEALAAGRRRTEREPEATQAPSSTAPGARSAVPPIQPRERGERPARENERLAPWETGPDARIGQAAPPPPAGNYGDWTKPSRDQAERRRPARAPETAMIPERASSGRDAGRPDSGEMDLDRPENPENRPENRREKSRSSDSGSLTSTRVVGGRAALRAQRQAADAERRKSARQHPAEPDGPAAPTAGKGRRMALALVAVAVVALGVLGVYSFTSPKTHQAAHTTTTHNSPAPTDAAAPAAQSLPPLDTGTQSPAPAPAAPVKVPITVLNATGVTGLAAKISGTFGGGGWPTTGVGAYKGGDVAATTVYFTQGDETQRQAAVSLVTQFPKLSGPVPRFFDVPGNPTPGLVVVAAGDWRP